MTLWIIYLTSTHPKLSKNVYMFIVLFLIVHLLRFVLKQVKTLCLQEQRVSFCGTLNELTFH